MERHNLLVCLGLIFTASALGTQLNPRGNRPVEQGTRGDKCTTQREWPFCTDDDWGPKCPSGCRIQGLLDQYDHSHLKRIEKIRSLLDQYKAKHRSADQVSKQTYDYLKEKLTIDSGNDNSYYDLAQNLRQRITDMKIKIDRQLRILSALKDRVKDQVIEMQRMEVDIDIKLRSCKGSCVSYTEDQLDKSTYVELEKQVDQLDTHAAQSVESVGTLYVMKSRQLKDVVVDTVFKSKDVISGAAAEQRQDMFPEVKTVKLILEEEGSSSSPASISKVPGTSYSPSTSSSSSSSVPSSSSSFSSSTSFSSSSHSSQPPFSSSSHSSQPSYSSSSHSSQPSYSSSSHSSQPSYSSSSHSSQPSYTSSSHSSQPSYTSSSHSSQPPFSSSSHSSQPPFSSSSHSSTSYSSSSHSSQPSKSITELGGRGDGEFFGVGGAQPSTGHVSTKSVSCTKSVRRTIVHTKDGPVERTEEVMEGGPECQGATDLTKGGMGAFFPSLSHASSSSSSSSMSTKTMHAGGAKGSLLADGRHGFGFPPSGMDLGAFMMARVEDDMPDFHARSVKSTRVERQADYIGKDCVEAYQNHLKGETNGLFKIKPGGTESTEVVQVYCQQEGLMGGWLLVQQRESGMLSFNRTWAEYRKGFGSVNEQGKGEFWLGNKNLHLLTNQGETMLKVQLEDWEGGIASAEYIIRVGSEEEGYPLHVSGYTGDAGDALVMPKSDMASYLSHNGMKFSTFDRDNDKWEENCAEMFGGGWWYNNCQSANLNGIYYRGSYNPEKNTPYEIENGVIWVTYKPATYSLKTVRMFIRPAAF